MALRDKSCSYISHIKRRDRCLRRRAASCLLQMRDLDAGIRDRRRSRRPNAAQRIAKQLRLLIVALNNHDPATGTRFQARLKRVLPPAGAPKRARATHRMPSPQ